MDPQLFFAYSALIGLSIPVASAIIATILENNKSKNETTPTILSGKLSDSSDKTTNDIPKEVLQNLETTNSPFTHTQLSSEKTVSPSTNNAHIPSAFPTAIRSLCSPSGITKLLHPLIRSPSMDMHASPSDVTLTVSLLSRLTVLENLTEVE